MNAYNYDLFSGMLTSFEDRNYERLLKLRTMYLQGNPDEYLQDRYLYQTAPFPSKDREHSYNQTMMRYEDYINKDHPITFGLMYEKTGLQTLQNFLQNYGVYFLLFCVIYFSSDIIIKGSKISGSSPRLAIILVSPTEFEIIVGIPLFNDIHSRNYRSRGTGHDDSIWVWVFRFKYSNNDKPTNCLYPRVIVSFQWQPIWERRSLSYHC